MWCTDVHTSEADLIPYEIMSNWYHNRLTSWEWIIIMKLVNLWMLYAIQLYDNSLFCVFSSLDVICSANSHFSTETS
jgi:hypothetical protein